jgi:hypothetical protein
MYWCSLPVGAPVIVVAGFVLPSTIVVKPWGPNKPPSFYSYWVDSTVSHVHPSVTEASFRPSET